MSVIKEGSHFMNRQISNLMDNFGVQEEGEMGIQSGSEACIISDHTPPLLIKVSWDGVHGRVHHFKALGFQCTERIVSSGQSVTISALLYAMYSPFRVLISFNQSNLMPTQAFDKDEIKLISFAALSVRKAHHIVQHLASVCLLGWVALIEAN